MPTLIMAWCPLLFGSPRSLPSHVQTQKFSFTSGVVTLSLYFSRAQLLPLALSLEHGWEQSFKYTSLDNIVCPAQGPIYFLLHLYPTHPKLNKICLNATLSLLNSPKQYDYSDINQTEGPQGRT